jgi:hypothetical protein
MQYEIIQANKEYYIYVVLVGKSSGNFSIAIENAKYMIGAEVVETTLFKNFSITNETASFSVNPGAVSASGDFSIEVQNLKDNSITVSVKTSEGNSGEREILIPSANSTETSFSLISGEKKEINFKPGVGNKTLRFIEIKNANLTYKVPVYLWEVLEGNKKSTFVLEPSSLLYTFTTSSVVKKVVYLYNTGSSDIKDITISLDEELVPLVNLSVTEISKLAANSKTSIELTFFSKAEVSTLGNIKAKTGEDIAYSSLTLRFINNYTEVIANETIQSTEKTCEDLSGEVCDSTQECSQEPVYAKDNLCCLATCETIKTTNSGTIIAIIIILFIVAIGAWFYLVKYKKTKKSPINFLKIAKGKDNT